MEVLMDIMRYGSFVVLGLFVVAMMWSVLDTATRFDEGFNDDDDDQ